MIKSLCFSLFTLVFLTGQLYAQDEEEKAEPDPNDPNLVINGNLDEYSGTLRKTGKFYLVDDWNSLTPTRVDYFEVGNELADISIPDNVFGHQSARSGEHYAGIYAFSYDPKKFRSYMVTKFRRPMVKGKMYCVKYMVSLADRSRFGISNLGAYLSKSELEFEERGNVYLQAQVKNSLEKVLKNTMKWQSVCNVFIAKGGEEYLILGNLDTDADVVLEKVLPPSGMNQSQLQVAYYYVDDVSVKQIDSYGQCNCSDKKDRGPDIVYSKSITVADDAKDVEVIDNSTIYFGFLKKEINSSAMADLDRLAALLEENPNYRIKIAGYTDSDEAEEAKEEPQLEKLSRDRAYFAVDYLANKGIDKSRFDVYGLGDKNPASSGKTPLSKAKNRRVVFMLVQ